MGRSFYDIWGFVLGEKKMTTEEEVRKIVVKQLRCKPEAITLDASFKGLGASELDPIVMVLEMETDFGIEISDEEAEKITTLGEAIKCVESKI